MKRSLTNYLLLSFLGLTVLGARSTSYAGLGQRAAEFSVPGLDGRQVSLHAQAGKVVLIDFWASWCEPCKEELPELQKLQAQYASKGVVVIAMNIDQRRENAEKLTRKLGINLSVGLDADGKVAEKYDPPKMPSSFVIDKKGVIRFIHAGYDGAGDIAKLRRELDQLTAN